MCCGVNRTCLTRSREYLNNCNRKRALCLSIVPFGISFTSILFILGIFVGPIWLLAISVLVGMATVLVLGYLYNNSRMTGITNPTSNMNQLNNNYITTSNLNTQCDGSILPPFCIYDIKLPTYEDVLEEKRQNPNIIARVEDTASHNTVTQQQRDNSYFQIIGVPPPSYHDGITIETSDSSTV